MTETENTPQWALHMSHIIGRLDLQADERIAMLMRRLQALRSFPTDYELEELDQLSSSQLMLTVDAVIELLKAREDGQFNPGLMWLEDAKILSRLEANAGPDVVVERVTAAFSSASWPSLVGHIAFDTEVLLSVASLDDDGAAVGEDVLSWNKAPPEGSGGALVVMVSRWWSLCGDFGDGCSC